MKPPAPLPDRHICQRPSFDPLPPRALHHSECGLLPAILVLVASLALFAVGCTATGPTGSPAPAPSLAPHSWQPAENPNPFGGFIYPGEGDNTTLLELDAPLRTLLQEPQGQLGFGPEYYAFTVNVRVRGLRIPELILTAPGGQRSGGPGADEPDEFARDRRPGGSRL